MQNVLFFVDRVSSWIGQAFSWLIVALTFVVSIGVRISTVPCVVVRSVVRIGSPLCTLP